jgi:hypothetical protein
MGVSGIKSITPLSSSGFYRKIMQKYQTGKKNISRFPSMIFFKEKRSVSPQKIDMILKFSLHLNQQNILPVLILRNVPVTGGTIPGFNTEKKSLQSVFKLKEAQSINNVAKIFLTSFKIPQEYHVTSEHFLTRNISVNKIPVFPFLKSLVFKAGNITNNSNRILKSLFSPASNVFFEQKTCTISPNILTLNSKLLRYENNIEILNSYFWKKIRYRLLNTVSNLTFIDNENTLTYLPVFKNGSFIDNENTLTYLPVFKNGSSSDYFGKHNTVPSLIVKNISVIKETSSWLNIEKYGIKSPGKPEDASNINDIANVSLAALRIPEMYQITSGILPTGKISTNKIPVFSSLKYFIFKAEKMVINSNQKLQSSFLPVIDKENTLKYWPLFEDKSPLNHSGNKNIIPFFIPSLVVKNIPVIKEIFSRLNTEINCLQSIAKQKGALNVNYAAKVYVSRESFKVPQGFHEGSKLFLTGTNFTNKFLTGNVFTKKISVFSLLKSSVFRAGNITSNSSRILNSSFSPVKHDFYSLKTRIIFPDILALNPKTGRVHALLINSKKVNMTTVIDKHVNKFRPLRFSTTNTHHDPFLKSLVFKVGNKITNSNRILKLLLLSENYIYHQQATNSIYSVPAEVSSQTLNYKINKKILNSQVFRANKNYGPLNITRHSSFINKKNILKNQPSFKDKLPAFFLQDNLLFNKRPDVNRHFFKESNWVASNGPLIKNYYGNFEHWTPGYVPSKYNYKIRNESLVFQDQENIKQEIEQIKKTVIETKKSVSEKTVPVFGEAEIKKYLDINRISSQVYQNIERTIRMERERRGV